MSGKLSMITACIHVDDDLMKSYLRRDFEALAFSDLKKPININGDTIVHLLAKKLDRPGCELILSHNPKAFTNAINKANKNLELPIHAALQNARSGEFIDYMVSRLGASFHKGCPDKIKKYNDVVINNIKNLTKMAEGTEGTEGESMGHESNGNISFIKDIINYYNQMQDPHERNYRKNHQDGGYRRHTYKHDSFKLPQHEKNRYFNDKFYDKLDSEIKHREKNLVGGNCKFSDKNDNSMQFLTSNVHNLKLKEEIIRNTRLSGNNKDPLLRERERKLNELRNQFVNKRDDLFGGKQNLIGGDDNNENIGDDTPNLTEFDSPDEESKEGDTGSDAMFGGKRKKGKDKKKAWDNDLAKYWKPKGDLKWLADNDSYSTYSQDRPHRRFRERTESDKLYASFVDKIKEFLDKDDETAKLYRAAIKITLEEKYPELRGREHDKEKIDEMKKIIENKDKLEKFIKEIDMDKIKDIIKTKREEGEKRREERMKMRETERKEHKENVESSEEDEKNGKEKKEKKTKKSKMARLTHPTITSSDERYLDANDGSTSYESVNRIMGLLDSSSDEVPSKKKTKKSLVIKKNEPDTEEESSKSKTKTKKLTSSKNEPKKMVEISETSETSEESPVESKDTEQKRIKKKLKKNEKKITHDGYLESSEILFSPFN